MNTNTSQHSPEDQVKLVALRADIQLGIDQLDRGEVIRDFDVKQLLAECHARRVERQAQSSIKN
jgi:hypothetical protein